MGSSFINEANKRCTSRAESPGQVRLLRRDRLRQMPVELLLHLFAYIERLASDQVLLDAGQPWAAIQSAMKATR